MQCTTSKAAKGQREGKWTEHTQREGAGAHHLPPVDTTTAPKREPQRKPLQSSKSKYILNFALFGLRKSRENTKAHQKIIHFWPLLPWFDALLTLWVPEESGSRSEWKLVCYIESRQKEPPPPYFGVKKALYPHNFSHHKNRKKFAYLWLEKFPEIFYGRMFRVKGSPQSWGEGARC